MIEPLKPSRGGFHRPVRLGLFTRDLLRGLTPEGSKLVGPVRGAPQSDINHEYHEAQARLEARERAERIISDLVVKGEDVTEERAEAIYQQELSKIPRKSRHMKYHSFLMYFGVLKRLGWVEPSGQTEPSSLQENYPPASGRIFYRLSEKGLKASDQEWSNPLASLYPHIGRNHRKKPA